MKDNLEVEVKDLKVSLHKELTEEIMLENLNKKQNIEMEKLVKKQTAKHQEQMFLKLMMNNKTNVHSRGTQVEVGKLDSEPLPDTNEIKMEDNEEDSFSLLEDS